MAKNTSINQNKYDKAHCRTYHIKLHLVNDADIIEKLASVPSMQGYIKQLIRQNLADSVPERQTDSVPVPFRDPYVDPIAKAVGKWIDDATSILTDGRPYVVCDSVSETEREEK